MKFKKGRRFVNFISSIRHSSKNVLRDFLKYVEYDTMSVTGRNLRNISLKTNINDIRMISLNKKSTVSM